MMCLLLRYVEVSIPCAGRKETDNPTGSEALLMFGVNDAPSFAHIEDVELEIGSPLHISLDGSDPENDDLTFRRAALAPQ